MSRLKPLLFVVGLSLVSAVTLRFLLGRMATPSPSIPTAARTDSAEMDRRMVGCGHFRFVLDSLGYRTGQWPPEVDSALAAARLDAVFLARDGRIVAVDGEERGAEVGRYVIRIDTVYVSFGDPGGGGWRARLGPVGDSLGGALERTSPAGSVGRLFVARPVPVPGGCRIP